MHPKSAARCYWTLIHLYTGEWIWPSWCDTAHITYLSLGIHSPFRGDEGSWNETKVSILCVHQSQSNWISLKLLTFLIVTNKRKIDSAPPLESRTKKGTTARQNVKVIEDNLCIGLNVPQYSLSRSISFSCF